jgi:hypothetical protein
VALFGVSSVVYIRRRVNDMLDLSPTGFRVAQRAQTSNL